MTRAYFEYCIYPTDALGGKFAILPGVQLHDKMEENYEVTPDIYHSIRLKLEQSSRKICMMWHAAEEAKKAESEFYFNTIKEAPLLFGEDAIKVHYHLESMVLLARSAMDIATTAFGWNMPDPFTRKRFDSFNRFVKEFNKHPELELSKYFNELRNDETSWLSIIAGSVRGRSLRDKLAHQTEFPIDYVELNKNSEKRKAVVKINEHLIPLDEFIDSLCEGIINGFLEIERISLLYIVQTNSSICTEVE